MADEKSLLAAILLHPADDTPRLVYADYLDDLAGEENAVRAAFIRCQLKLAEADLARVRLRGQLIEFGQPLARGVAETDRLATTGGRREVRLLLSPPKGVHAEWLLSRYANVEVTETQQGGKAGTWLLCGHVERIVAGRTLPGGRCEVVLKMWRHERQAEWTALENAERQLYARGGAAAWPDPLAEKEAELAQDPALNAAARAHLLDEAFRQRAAQRDQSALGEGRERGYADAARRVLEEPPSLATLRPYVDRGSRAYINMAGPRPRTGPAIEFRRGFVHLVTCRLTDFMVDAGFWFGHQPIQEVHLRDTTPAWHGGQPGWELRGHETDSYHSSILPPVLWHDLKADGVYGGNLKLYPTVDAANVALLRVLRRYGRRRAEGFSFRDDLCPACRGTGVGRCQPHAHSHGMRFKHPCEGTGQVSGAGLPDYAGDE